MPEPSQRASRRPSIPFLVVAVLMIAFGLFQATQPVTCGDDEMLAGDSCLVLDGGASRTLTYEQSVVNHQRTPYILVGGGLAVGLAGVVVGLVLARGVDSPKGQTERLAWEQQIATTRRGLVSGGAPGGPRELAELDRRAAKERRSRRYPALAGGSATSGRAATGGPRPATPVEAVNRTSGVVNGPATSAVGRTGTEPAPRHGSRRPVIRLVLLGVVLFVGGLVLWSSTDAACRGQAMAAGETCTVSQGRTSVERTAEEQLSGQRAPARVLMGAGAAAAVLSVPLGLFRGRRLRRVSDSDQLAWEAEVARRRDVPPPS